MFEEVNEKRFREKLSKGRLVAFFHTPFCGTCKRAEKMINVVLESMKPNFDALSCNLNLMPSLAETFEITSVPCLLMIEDGKVKNRIFSFGSIDQLYHSLLQFSENKP